MDSPRVEDLFCFGWAGLNWGYELRVCVALKAEV